MKYISESMFFHNSKQSNSPTCFYRLGKFKKVNRLLGSVAFRYMALSKIAAEKIEKELKDLHKDFSIHVEPQTNKVSALIKGVALGFDEFIKLAHIAKEHKLWVKRSGNKVGFYIS